MTDRRLTMLGLLVPVLAACGPATTDSMSSGPVEAGPASSVVSSTMSSEAMSSEAMSSEDASTTVESTGSSEATNPSEATTTTAESTTSTTEATTTAPPVTSPLYLVDVYDPARDPAADLDAAVVAAAAEGKHVITIVGGDWCPDCVNLDAFLADRPDLAARVQESFILVKVNLSEANTNDAFMVRYPGFEWVPHFWIFDGSGTMVESYDTRGLMVDGLFDHGAFDDFLARYPAT